MPKQRHGGVATEGPTNTRKRGCSSSSSSSSRIHHYRLNKRPIVVGRSRAGSRSGNPVLRSSVESPNRYSQSGRSAQPVSARRLAATLWEMNEMPSPTNSEAVKQQQQQQLRKSVFKKEKMQSGWGLRSGSGSPHLSEPPQSPTVISEVGRSGIGSERRSPSISQRLTSVEQNASLFDSISNATSFMEAETRSRPPTSTGSVSGGGRSRSRLKDVSNALSTSKELVKIINRIWVQANQPSSSMSVISALHTELERGRVQVHHLMQHEQRTDGDEIHHLMSRFAEEKASWRIKEREAVEAAVASVAGKLEVERKLRRRLESLNKKLEDELTEIKSSFVRVVKELESEKRAREITEQLCDELARNVDEDRARVEKLKSESIKIHQEAEKEREMLELADKLREGRVQMKISEAKHQFEEKSSTISRLRKQLEVFLGAKRDKVEDSRTSFSKSSMASHQQDEREVNDDTNSKADADSLELIELSTSSTNNTSRIHKRPPHSSAVTHDLKARTTALRSNALQRAISEGVEWGIRRGIHHENGDGFERQGFPELEKEASRRSLFDERQGHIKPARGLLDHVLSSPRSSLTRRDCNSPSQPLPSRKPKW